MSDDELSKCSACSVIFDRGKTPDDKIKCLICEKEFHASCTTVSRSQCQYVNKNANLFWSCDDCLSLCGYFSKILNKLNEIDVKISENANKLKEHDTLLEKINKAGEIRFTANQSPLNPIRANKRYASVLKDNESDTDFNNLSPKLRKINAIAPVKVNDKRDPILVVQTKNEEQKKDLQNKVRKMLSISDDPVKGTKVTANGKVIVHCNDHQAVSVIKNKLISKLEENITVDEPKSVAPRLRVVGVDAEHINTADDSLIEESLMLTDEVAQVSNNQEQLLGVIRKQNSDVIGDNAELQIINVRKRYDKRYDVVISCDYSTYNSVMLRCKLKIGWDICSVFEQLNVLRCYKCNAFGHTAADCNETQHFCPRCAENHEIKDCKSKILKCINCVRSSQRLNISLDVNHSVWSTKCKVFERKINQKRQTTRYKQ